QAEISVKSVQHCTALAQDLVEQNLPAIAIHHGMPQGESVPSHPPDFLCLHTLHPHLSFWVSSYFGVFPVPPSVYFQEARAGQFGHKGLAITFVSDENTAKILSDVQGHTEVSGSELPDEMDISSSSEY
ncbi:DX39B helicase, partial [Crocuta crocuta]